MRPGAACHAPPAAKRAKGTANSVAAASAALAAAAADALPAEILARVPAPPPADLDAHVESAWKWWESIGAPKYHVAPMVDQVRRERERWN